MRPIVSTPFIFCGKCLMSFVCLFVFSFILLGVLPAAAADSPGFIAYSESDMTWDEALAFCQEKGGKLPLINGGNSIDFPRQDAPIDGVGVVGGPWPTDLPKGDYWTGSKDKLNPDHTFSFFNIDGKITVAAFFQEKDSKCRVVCVP